MLDNGNGVFGDAENKFVIIIVTEIKRPTWAIKKPDVNVRTVWAKLAIWKRVVQSFDALYSYKLHNNNNNNNNSNNCSVEYQNTRCCYQRSETETRPHTWYPPSMTSLYIRCVQTIGVVCIGRVPNSTMQRQVRTALCHCLNLSLSVHNRQQYSLHLQRHV